MGFIIKGPTSIATQRVDTVDHYKKKLLSERTPFEILVHDPEQLLIGVYPRDNQYAVLKPNEWVSGFYKRYLSLKNTKTPSQREDYVSPPNELKMDPLTLNNELLKRKWIRPTGVKGTYVYSDDYVRLQKKLLSQLIVDVPQYRFSPLIKLQDHLRVGYLRKCAQNLYYVSKIHTKVKDLQVRSFLEGKIDNKLLQSYLNQVTLTCNYCSCHGLYPALQHENLPEKFMVHDKQVGTMRNEQGRVWGLERLESFTRIEWVMFDQNVSSMVESHKEHLKKTFEKWNIHFKIVKTSSWYSEDLQGSGYTYDFNAQVGKDLEMGNVSYNHDHWTSAYDIRCGNKVTKSACSGVGLQRLVYIYLLFNGFDGS